MTVGGTLVAEYPLPTAGSRPAGIVVAPDGALWFAEQAGNKLGRLEQRGL
jgi:virginiamycin B lyase